MIIPVANDDTVALNLTEDGANGTVNILLNPTTLILMVIQHQHLWGHTIDLDPAIWLKKIQLLPQKEFDI
jgi:hypothetical protein